MTTLTTARIADIDVRVIVRADLTRSYAAGDIYAAARIRPDRALHVISTKDAAAILRASPLSAARAAAAALA